MWYRSNNLIPVFKLNLKLKNLTHYLFSLFFREVGPVMYQSKERFVSSNLIISKEISITPINNVENSIISNLKKLPDITFHIVDHEPTLQVPGYPKLDPKKKYGSNDKSKFELERRTNHTAKNSNFQKSSLHKPEKKSINNITELKKIKNRRIISKYPVEITNKYSYSEIKNINTQRPSSLKKLPKKILYPSNNKSKNLNSIKSVKETSNIFTSFHEMKTISDNNLIVSNIQNKTNEKQPLLQDNTINHTIDTWTVHKDRQLLQEMRSIFCGNLIENTTEFETKSMEFTNHAYDITLNNNNI